MRMVDLIEKKRNGEFLSKEEIDFMIAEYTSGEIPDYQMSAFAMAVYFQDMTDEEITHLTLAMANSGDVIDLSALEGIKVDKHSTGGVGDTTTLVLAPLVATLGVPVAKMSGRGLGHTGGTLDKFEAIPHFSIEMSEEKFIQSVNQLKVAVIGQSGDLAPADKRLYALRDVTATVESVPMIASSIMSKKIAAGADAIVLDVTVGDGAFMKTTEEATRLAQTMVRIGELAGRKTMAVISDMSEPLGFAIGNSLEVVEAIHALRGEGPADLMELVYTLAAQMLMLAEVTDDFEQAKKMLVEKIENGEALEKFREMVANQGGDVSIVDEPEKLLTASVKKELFAEKSGYITRMVADKIGVAAMKLGAGREKKEDDIDFAVGILLHKKVGDYVEVGESLLTIHANNENTHEVEEILRKNIFIGENATAPQLIHGIITGV
ncbi:pyrimidine-nucleoside phosphorylase [Pilibacter termitis]|uniref:Pyrimidine-nucleoside phosphorylase n=1 Tax=Pilibacter termitis TaxID=263852 RepID=A0A1T4MI53_9ENTE|nr:pyrimidine-nucleoside phosphorylase [Pilibacter termitis]SJZ66632.1 pyrimidine-nucleoside phosphorylase [Pilibacter termitis]